MFYSHSLLSRKGPLGNIWMAAYCFKRLRRDQIASTDISSSIDEIHSQAKMSYRVLGHLLLGVVRIYSWKVEYLYKDCEEVLTYISHCGIPKGHVRKYRRGIVVGKEVIRPSTRNTTSAGKAMLAEPMETMRASYHAITAPGSFELDAFELEDMDAGEQTTRLHKKSMIQDNLVENHEDSFRSENYQRVPIAHTELNLACFTPVKDVLPSDMMDIDLEINQLKDSDIAEGRRQEPRRDFWHLVEFGNPESLGPKMLLGLNIHEEEHDHPVDLPEFQERVSSDINQDVHESVGPTICLSSNLKSKEQSHQKDTSDLPMPSEMPMPLGINQDRHTKESQNQPRPHNLRVRVLPVHEKSPEIREVQDPSSDKSNSPHEAGLASPKFAVTTPAKREHRKVLRKRKGYFDETIVLSNATLRQAIHDASNLVCKRRKMPQTVLDIWKSSKITNLQHNFMDPLIPFVSPDLKALLLKKLHNNRSVRKFSPSNNQEINMQDVPRDILDSGPIQQRSPADSLVPETSHEVSTNKLQDVPSNVLNVEGTIQQRLSSDRHKGIATSERQDVPINVLDLQGPVQQRTASETLTPASRHEVPLSNKLEEVKVQDINKETSDSGSDLMDLELGACGTGSSSNQGSIGDDGSPLRTRAMVQYLHDRFLNLKEQKQKGTLSFTQILEGKTRAECARCFYEILCLKDRRCIDVKQDSPYGDITLSPTPELDTMFKNL